MFPKKENEANPSAIRKPRRPRGGSSRWPGAEGVPGGRRGPAAGSGHVARLGYGSGPCREGGSRPLPLPGGGQSQLCGPSVPPALRPAPAAGAQPPVPAAAARGPRSAAHRPIPSPRPRSRLQVAPAVCAAGKGRAPCRSSGSSEVSLELEPAGPRPGDLREPSGGLFEAVSARSGNGPNGICRFPRRERADRTLRDPWGQESGAGVRAWASAGRAASRGRTPPPRPHQEASPVVRGPSAGVGLG